MSITTEQLDAMLAAATPGPWICYADIPSADPNWHIVTTANKLRVLANVHIEPGNSVDPANAALIAAAPTITAELIAARTRIAELEGALRALLDLNDNHGPFGGEMYQDRIDRTWDRSRAALGDTP